ncbi:MAG: cyclophilin-like fold protein [Oscillospiraceae bacterium]
MGAAMKLISLLVSTVLISGCADQTEDIVSPHITEQPSEQTENKQSLNELEIQIGEQTFYAELYNTEAAEEIAALLPITIDMSELNGNEKYYYLNEPLTTDSCIPDRIHTGDIMLYGSSCLVLFYEDFSTSYSYTPIGHIKDTKGLRSALGSGEITISFK